MFFTIGIFAILFFESILEKIAGIDNNSIVCSIFVNFELFFALVDKSVIFLIIFFFEFIRKFGFEIYLLDCRFIVRLKI